MAIPTGPIIRPAQIPTPEEKEALVGTSGTPPSASNPLVDDADTRLSDARTPTSHGNEAHSVSFAEGAHDHSGVYEPADSDIQSHIGATGNPHGTTASDVGAEPADAAIQSHIGTTGNPHGTTYGDVGAAASGHDHSGTYEPADSDIQSHIGATGNPHGTTASDVGAEPADAAIQSHIGTTGNPHGTTYGDVGAAASGHDHSGTYEPADAAIQSHIGETSGNPHGTDYADVGAAPTVHDHPISAGINGAVPTFTDNGGLKISVTSCSVHLYATTDFSGALGEYTVAAANNLDVTDNVINYLVVSYGGGTPAYSVTTDVSTINESSVIPINTLLVTGGYVHFGHWDSMADGLANKIHRRLVKTQRHVRESGLGLSVVGGVVNIDEGIVWRGARAFGLSDVYSDGSGSSYWYFYYHDTGVWVHTTNATAFDNLNYDDGTDLIELTNNNKYTINWVFRGIEDHNHGYVILSHREYGNLPEAIAETTVPDLPPMISQHAILVGRLIFKKSIAVPEKIEGAFDYEFSGEVINNHNDLGGLDGGQAGEYFHLTSAEHTDVIAHAGATGNPHGTTASDVGAEPANVNIQTHIGLTSDNPHGTDKTDIGLSNVTNDAQIPLLFATENNGPAGFPVHTGITLSLTENVGGVNDTFNVTITGTNFIVYCDGTRYTKNTQTTSNIVGATTKRYYVYYDATGTLTISGSPWSLEAEQFNGEAPVCTVYWDAVNHRGLLEDERHHSWRDIHWHHWAHDSLGARYRSGFDITKPVSAAQIADFSINQGEMYDEDISNESNATPSTVCQIWYHNGADMVFERDSAVLYKLTAGVPQYDNGTGLANKTASNTQGYFVSWIYAGNSYDDTKMINVIIGQDTDGNMTLTQAQNAAYPSLPAGFVVEWKLLYKIIWLYNAGTTITWVSTTDYRQSSSLPSGLVPTSNVSAGSVSFSPSGTVASVNVQAAIEELDTEKQAALTFGIADTNAVRIDHAAVADNDYAKFTANGIEGRDASEVLGDIGALPVAGGTMTGNITLGENTAIVLDPAGSADGKWSGVTMVGTAGYTAASGAFGDLVMLDKDSTNRWEKADVSAAADALGDARCMLAMMLTDGPTDGSDCTLLLMGNIRADANFPTLTIGFPVYASTTGDVTTTQPSTSGHVIRIIGWALTADEIHFRPDGAWITKV